MLRYLTRIVFFLGLVGAAIYFFIQAQGVWNAPQEIDPLEPSQFSVNEKLIINFGGFIVTALAAGALFGFMILPIIGEIIGGAFFNPGGEIEKDPHHDALAFAAQGDYEAAIAAYRKVVNENPHDTHAISEIARINIEKLGNPAGAAEIFEEALQNEWPPDEGGFLAFRLADIYWTQFADAERAKTVLQQIIDSMPGTRHSANANHKIIEIDRSLAQADETLAEDQESQEPS